ncbi:hypothetical protein O9992_24305 [Vibrio lentus]|nr:hypothetical protein [Vibrio lentus]
MDVSYQTNANIMGDATWNVCRSLMLTCALSTVWALASGLKLPWSKN